MTCDGNTAAAHIAYMFSEVAAIYPITPSSTMAELVDEWASQKRKNIFGEVVHVEEMQSEAGAAAAMHGSLQAGALTTTFTASQGLLLMIPNMYKMAGELLPGVFHVSARALAAQALSIFGDHQDVMAARSTGFAQLVTGSVQEVMDLAAVAHLAALKCRVPFIHFFDGFRTSHEIQKIDALTDDDLRPLIDRDALEAFRKRALSPNHPVTRGTAQNGDIYFQAREAANKFYEAIPEVVQETMDQLAKITGRSYKLFDYYGAEDAENIIIAMGSVTETTRQVIDHLAAEGRKVGLLAIHLYRPFSIKHFMEALPKSVKRIAVLDRSKEPGAEGEPLYMDVKGAFYGSKNTPLIVGGRYGLSSKDVTPAQILSVYDNLDLPMPKDHFTIGIVDDVTFTSLPVKDELLINEGAFEAKFFGLGADGTVGANKNSVKIIGDNTDKYCQAYFAYDSKKSGGFTASHLRFGDRPIRSTYLVVTPDFVACHVPAYLRMYDVMKGLKKGGSFLLNAIWDKDEIEQHLPNKIKRYLAQNNIKFYAINATAIAQEIGLGNRTNTILQSAFFKIANVIPYDQAVDEMKKFIVKSYGRKGEAVVNMNYQAVDRGSEVIEIPVKAEWASLPDDEAVKHPYDSDFVHNVVRVINAQQGDSLPVSTFVGREDGTWENGTADSEKRGVAAFVPRWISENCIQCNQCAYVCPHATIRPFLLDEAERNATGLTTLNAIGKGLKEADLGFRIQVNVLDCLGCGNCASVCPGNKNGKALEMVALDDEERKEQRNWDLARHKVTNKAHLVDVTSNVKNSQFAQPLFEYSGACAGCGETPYVKLLTQLFGSRQLVANATGCSSIYSASAPSTPYTTNPCGQGPAWANSLFEDNAEFGLGMVLAQDARRNQLKSEVERVVEAKEADEKLLPLLSEWLENFDNSAETRRLSDAILSLLNTDKHRNETFNLLKDNFLKPSQWIIGGDGWAYDIGFGGLDHVLASGKNVNVLVLDTEVYSNTGGQSSKSTPLGAIAKFASSGKRVHKKDLGLIATTYGYVFVAQIAMGANHAHTLKMIREAEAYPGPSLVIAYSPCISHGLKGGMGKSQAEEARAVECGYWHLWHYDPRLEDEGKRPFVLDSKEPDWSKFKDFLKGEVRFSSLYKMFPTEADELADASLRAAMQRYSGYVLRSNMDPVTLPGMPDKVE